MSGSPDTQLAGQVWIDGAEPGYFGRTGPQSQQCAQRHRQVDPGCQPAAGGVTRSSGRALSGLWDSRGGRGSPEAESSDPGLPETGSAPDTGLLDAKSPADGSLVTGSPDRVSPNASPLFAGSPSAGSSDAGSSGSGRSRCPAGCLSRGLRAPVRCPWGCRRRGLRTPARCSRGPPARDLRRAVRCPWGCRTWDLRRRGWRTSGGPGGEGGRGTGRAWQWAMSSGQGWLEDEPGRATGRGSLPG